MAVINPRRSLLVLAAAWIGGANAAKAQAVAPEASPPGARPPQDPERRARMQQLRAELGRHIEAARGAIARRQAGPATEAVERAETLLLNAAAARAGREAVPGAGARGEQRGARARAALATARTALASNDFAAAEAALRPLAERMQRAPRAG